MTLPRWLSAGLMALALAVLPPLNGELRAQPAEPVIAPPWLRTVLPEDALAYARLAHPWGVLGNPKGTALDPLQSTLANAAAISGLRQGLGELLAPVEPLWGQAADWLLNTLDSPLELALLAPAGPQPLPRVMLAGTLAVSDIPAARAALERLTALHPGLAWLQPLDAEGYGILGLMGQPMPLHFDPASRHLLLLAGAVPDTAALAAFEDTLRQRDTHPMYPLEREIDTSGQGLFAWIDAAAVVRLGEPFVPPPMRGALEVSGIRELRQIAFGMGTSGGRGRLELVALMPWTGFRQALPAPELHLDLPTGPETTSVGLLGLPSAAQWEALRGLRRLADPEGRDSLAALERGFRRHTGTVLADWWRALGPDLVYLNDGHGAYWGLRLRDPALFERLLSTLDERLELALETREVDGQTYTHLALPALLDRRWPAERMPRLWRQLLVNPGHLYWTREGDYLLLAPLPQPLFERVAGTAGPSVGLWLRDEIGLDGSDAVLALAARVSGVPRLYYAMHLRLLQYLGDALERPVDLFALPTARQAAVPVEGRYALQLGSSAERLSLELLYESNPLELLFAGNSTTTLIAAGVITAVAIPAYQDYRIRARVGTGLQAGDTLRQALQAHHERTGRFPDPAEFEALARGVVERSEVLGAARFDPQRNRLVLTLAAPPTLVGKTLTLSARPDNGALDWRCSSEDIAPRYLPARCR